jgi:hypothetical protein
MLTDEKSVPTTVWLVESRFVQSTESPGDIVIEFWIKSRILNSNVKRLAFTRASYCEKYAK